MKNVFPTIRHRQSPYGALRLAITNIFREREYQKLGDWVGDYAQVPVPIALSGAEKPCCGTQISKWERDTQ
jgi:hypothetical protein